MNAIVKHSEQITSLIRAYFKSIDNEAEKIRKEAGMITPFEYQGIKNAGKKK